MPAYVRVGSEFAVNSQGAQVQNFPRTATFSDGRFIVVWQTADTTQDGSGSAIRAQMFAANGTPIGGEFLVNTQTASNQEMADVAVLDNGNFVVTWHTINATQDGSSGAIKAQMYSGSGSPIGGEFLVNTTAAGNQYRPELTQLAGGGFVIGWLDANTTSGDIRGQAYNASGQRVGAEFLVNNLTASNQTSMSITGLSNGGFVAIWQTADATVDGSNTTVQARIFGANGVATGPEFTVPMQTLSFQASPAIVGLANGNFVAVWSTLDTTQDGSGSAIKAQIFSATGVRIGGEFLVNNVAAGSQDRPTVTQTPDGGFVIAWYSSDTTQDGSGSAIKARSFDANGVPLDGELLLNTLASGNQTVPHLATLSDGRVVSTWVSESGDGSGLAIRGQLLAPVVTLQISSNGGGDTAAITMEENGSPITTVVAVTSGAAPTYAITGGADAASFAIDAVTGALSFINSPNFEAPSDTGGDNVYDVVVSAAGSGQTDTQAIAVTVVNQNEALSITSNGGGETAAVAITEGISDVTAVTAVDVDGTTPTYSIVGGADAALFAIDVATGALSLIAPPDHETPTDADGDNIYEVIVQASDGALSDTQTISVTVGNVNEAPVIDSDGGGENAALTVNENAGAVTIVSAGDVDGPAISYAIAGGADAALFVIDPVTGVLSFIAAPDFEAPADTDGDNIYDVVVRVSDGELSDTQAISVTVSNVNEAPVISSDGGGASAAQTLNENGTVVTAVSAGDVDGSAISYAIAGGSDAALFVIDPSTGVLSFIVAPDFEAPGDADLDNVYDVLVSASDGMLIDIQSLLISVADVNEAPEIVSGGGGSAAAYTIDEGAGYIDTIAATDPEGNPRTFTIVGGADAARFAIDPITGALAFAGAADFEAPTDADGNNVYELIVEASDGTLVDTQILSVSVSNVNETPVIVSNGGGATAAVTVNENAVAVANVASTDPDGNPRSYSIVGGTDAARFAVDATTGALNFINAPNFEAPADADGNNVYDVVVQASDGTLFDTQAISVTVANVDEGPVITSNGGGATAVIQTNENNRLLPSVQATDAEGSAITYSIVGGADAARFTVNPTSGLLVFVDSPNYESPTDAGANNIYDIIVQASDGVNVTTQTLSIVVNNLIDGATINGGNGNNALTGTNAEDTIDGLGGNDTITGGLGADRLFGGTGADRFVYNALADSQVGAMDSIRDFSRSQGDRISLSVIDANANASGNQAFAFIGNAAFSNVAGQLRYQQANGNTVVSGDVNGDGIADFAIELNGIVNLQPADFIL